MRLWAVQQRNGDVMLTALRPKRCAVALTGCDDWYMRHGDPIGVRNLCRDGFRSLTGLEADLLREPVRVELTVDLIDCSGGGEVHDHDHKPEGP